MEILDKFKHTFEPQLLEEFISIAKEVSVKEGDVILDYGQIVRSMPIIASGTVKVSRMDDEGREILIDKENTNDSCAMNFNYCMEQFPSENKPVAEKDVVKLTVPITDMDEWLMKYSTWKSFVMGTIHDRFNEMLNTIDQIAFQKLDERLKYYLQQKAKHTGSKLLNLSHEEIARDLATSRVVISRLLKKLENDELLLLYRNQIKLLNAF